MWEISAYRPDPSSEEVKLVKEIPTIQNKLATIIKTEEKDLLTEEIKIND